MQKILCLKMSASNTQMEHKYLMIFLWSSVLVRKLQLLVEAGQGKSDHVKETVNRRCFVKDPFLKIP